VISQKQLERLFSHHIGISPKSFSSLIRYQLLWQEIVLSGHFNVQDAVDKFGYCDQAHLLNDFKKHHLIGIREAAEFAAKSR
jgi:methylphosphotriester-DNA--protein-cysteine methyltransferase